MTFNVIYTGIKDKSQLSKLVLLFRKNYPDVSKVELAKKLKATDLVFAENINEVEANNLLTQITDAGGGCELEQVVQEDDLDTMLDEEFEATSINTPLPPDLPPVSLWKRTAAYLIDIALLLVAVMLLGMLFVLLGGDDSEAAMESLGQLITLPLFLVYFTITSSNILPLSSGSRFMGIRIVDAQGQPLTLKQSFVRTVVFYFLSFLFIPAISILINAARRGIHDLAGKSYVIDADAELNPVARAINERAEKLAIKNFEKAQQVGMSKLQDMVRQLNSASPILQQAGYEISGMNLVAGLNPSVEVKIAISETANFSAEEFEEELNQLPVVKMLFNCIAMSVALQNKLKIKNMQSVGIEISLAMAPSARLMYAKNHSNLPIDGMRSF